MLLVAGAGCSEGLSDEAAPDASEPAGVLGPSSGGLPPGVSAAVVVDQDAILADGVVTDDEMTAALGSTVACLAELGAAGRAVPVVEGAGFGEGWQFEWDGSSPADDVLAGCRRVTISELELPYLSAARKGVAEQRVEAIRACLIAAGHTVDGLGLGEMFAAVGPASMRSCTPGSDGLDSNAGAGT